MISHVLLMKFRTKNTTKRKAWELVSLVTSCNVSRELIGAINQGNGLLIISAY